MTHMLEKIPPMQKHAKTISQLPLKQRLTRFLLLLGTVLAFVYGVLPAVTDQVPILARMHSYLNNNGIDPSRYYYTDVEQVAEGERYIAQAIKE